nr:hypothetical protein [Tanacetum cinerariifolium]
LGVESYQTKLNLTKSQLMEGCVHQKTLYTILSHPRGVVYKGTGNSVQKYNKYSELGIYHWDKHRQWFYKGSYGLKSRHDVHSKNEIISIQNIKVNDKYGYSYLNKIEERVEGIQLGVESYQTKLNLTKSQLMEGCVHQKTLYTILSHPRGVVYKGTGNSLHINPVLIVAQLRSSMQHLKLQHPSKKMNITRDDDMVPSANSSNTKMVISFMSGKVLLFLCNFTTYLSTLYYLLQQCIPL